jgi:hypothetical protein
MSAKSQYIEDRQYLIDKSDNPEKKRLSLGEEFDRRVDQGKIVVKNGSYSLNPSKEDKKKVKEFGLKSGKGTDFGMLSVKKGIDKNPKPTQADRIAGATMKDGSRTKVRGVRIANKGYRKAKLS